MSQINVIVLSIDAARTTEFEALFRSGEYPTWERLGGSGKLLYASLTRIAFGPQKQQGIEQYLVVAEFTGMDGHEAHDEDSAFKEYNRRADDFQPVEPIVFGGYSVARWPAG
jgi:hypothetical protein